MKDNNDKNIEQILLNDENYEKVLSKKIEQEFNSVLEQKSSQKTEKITDKIKLTKEQLFSKDSTFLVINKQSKTKSYINGLQAEGFIGNNDSIRKNFLAGNTNYFVNGEYYVRFCAYTKRG